MTLFDTDPYIQFYYGKQLTRESNLNIYQVMGLDEAKFEAAHDIVQLAFPTPTHSRARPNAVPDLVLTKDVAKYMQNNQVIFGHVVVMLRKILLHWGIEWQKEENLDSFKIVKHKKFRTRLIERNHNQLRFTRLLTFLYCINMNATADKLKLLIIMKQLTNSSKYTPQNNALEHWLNVNENTAW